MAHLFIKKTCKRLGLRVPATCTAQVLYNRFFFRQSLKDHDRVGVATACIFLAAKAEENWKSLTDVLEAAHGIRHNDKLQSLESDPEKLATLTEDILQLERIVLSTLSFDVSVDHPHKYSDKFVRLITSGQPRESRELLQATWNILNDSLSTTISLRYPARLIAASAVSLAVRLLKHKYSSQQYKPRFIENYGKFEKQGEIFGYSPSQLKQLEEELISFYESLSMQPNLGESTTNDDSAKEMTLSS